MHESAPRGGTRPIQVRPPDVDYHCADPFDRRTDTLALQQLVSTDTSSKIALCELQAEARRHTEQLLGAYDHLYAIAHSVVDGLASVDAAGSVTFWNRAAEAMFGYSEGQMLGRPMSSLLAAPCQEEFHRLACELLQSHESARHLFEGWGVRRDGQLFPLEMSLGSSASHAGASLVAVVRDVTARKHAEELRRLRERQVEHAHKMEAIARLARGIAYDFNNALAVIQGYGDLLATSVPLDDPHRPEIEAMVEAARSAVALARPLLEFGRTSTGEVSVVNPRESIAGIQKVLRRLLGDTVEITVDVDPELGCVRVDPGQLEQTLISLAMNAKEVMGDGGTLEIQLRNQHLDDPAVCHRLDLTPGDYVTIALRDSGPGMEENAALRIFEPFFASHDNTTSSGLQLAAAYNVIHQSGGRMDVDTAAGRGTTVFVHLPRVQAQHAPAPRGEMAADANSETILLVEDEQPVRQVIRQALETVGYNVLEAATGTDALDAASRHTGPIHLLLSDVVMPGISGYALWQSLAEQRPDAKVVFITGHGPGAAVREEVDSTALPCLQKPFAFGSLCRAVREALAVPDAHP